MPKLERQASTTTIKQPQEQAPVGQQNMQGAESQATVESEAPDKKQPPDVIDRFLGLYIDRPHQCLFGCCLVLLLLTVLSVLTGCMTFTLDQESAWAVHTGKFTQARTAWEQTLEKVRKDKGDNTNSSETTEFSLFYKAPSGDMVFTPQQLRDICLLESKIVTSSVCRLSGTQCPLFSPVPIFYPDGSAKAAELGCPLLSQARVDSVVSAMEASVQLNGTSSPFAVCLSREFPATKKAKMTRSMFLVTDGDEKSTQEVLLKDVLGKFDPPLEYGFLKSAFQTGAEDQMVDFGSVRVRMYFRFDEFMKMLPPDFSLAFLSVIFVYFTMWLYLGSFFIASFGMWQIVVSLPIAGIIYRKVFMVGYFEFVHVLVVYLVLGIGADDIFVFLDAWRHIRAEKGLKPGGGNPRSLMLECLRATWTRTATAVFNTSFTTAVAFLSMSVSEVMPMRTCGYYAAVCIVLCYIFSITFTPAIIIVHHLRISGKRCCCPSLGRIGDEAVPVETANGMSAAVEKLLSRVYLPLMQKRVGGIRPWPIFFLLVMIATAIQGTYFASKLTPPSKPEQWFPKDHMWIGLDKLVVGTYYSPDFDKFATATFTFGIDGMNFESFDQYKPDDYPGTANYDPSFDLSTAEAQSAFLSTCRAIRELRCELEGCESLDDKFVMSVGSQLSMRCVLEDFQAWYQEKTGSNTMPTGAAFVPALKDFREERAKSEDKVAGLRTLNTLRDIVIVDDRLLLMSITVRTTLPSRQPFGTGIDVRNLVRDFMKDWKATLPSSMQSFDCASNIFAQYDLGQELISGFFSGCAIAGPVVFIVLICSTQNIILAMFAVMSIGSIVMCVLGFCKSAMDYDLGVGEAIAGVIVIGYSVDYVVHLAHIYCDAAAHGIKTREERSVFAIKNMGATVFAGAITTAGSGMFMFFCFMTFFFKMAVLICMVIFYSFLFALFFFMSLAFLIGPEDQVGHICCGRRLRCGKGKEQGKEVTESEKDGDLDLASV
mmetsp:Transcript_29152/g.65999  ORF Transcript_29152/g.65999 Transcript_29152/m.65999 type:complete len:992 (-) Transcript_29152:160-3135(-)